MGRRGGVCGRGKKNVEGDMMGWVKIKKKNGNTVRS